MKRRSFLRNTLPVALAAPFVINGFRLDAIASTTDLHKAVSLADASDKVLVIIQLAGGNDALNTAIPADDDRYYKLRPAVGIPKNETLPLDGEPLLRLHPKMGGMQRMFNNKQMAIVSNIGYGNYSLSHFSSTEIWNTGSGSTTQETYGTGWIGRYLRQDFPQFPDVLPEDPPAIQISPSTSSLFGTERSTFGVALTDPATFYDLVNGPPNVDDEPPETTAAGAELHYIQRINAETLDFSVGIRNAARKVNNIAQYPSGNELGDALAVVARLIAGGLKTRVYMVSTGSFDQHGVQLPLHANLLERVSTAVEAFMDDLVALKADDRVVGMTYSEFGRRAADNGSGTDHGAAAAHFVFGSSIDGGKVFGGYPDLVNLDTNGNLQHSIEFQCYYASVIGPLFGLSNDRLKDVLPSGLCNEDNRVPLYRSSASAPPYFEEASSYYLSNAPNPASRETTIRYRTRRPGRVELTLYAMDGSTVALRLVDEFREAGVHTIRVPLDGIAAGSYLYRLLADDTMRSRTMQVIR